MVLEHNLGSTCGSQPLCYQDIKEEIRMMERMSFISYIFRSNKDLTKEVKKTRSEAKLGFQDEEGPSTSYQQKEDPVLHIAPKKHSMAFSFEYKRH